MKIKILILSSNPDPARLLRSDKEIKKIKRLHRQSLYRHEFELIFEPAISFRNFVDDVTEYQPDILHFICHANEQQQFLFEPEETTTSQAPQLILYTQIAQAIQRVNKCHTIKTVFLNTCHSAKIAKQLATLKPEIAEVIGIEGEISDADAIILSERFYQKFFETKNTQNSLSAAKNILSSDRPPLNHRDLGGDELENPAPKQSIRHRIKLYINGRSM